MNENNHLVPDIIKDMCSKLKGESPAAHNTAQRVRAIIDYCNKALKDNRK